MQRLHQVFILVYLFIYLLVFAQVKAADSTQWVLLNQLQIQYKTLQIDRMGNSYLVSPSNQLFKYSKNFERLSTLNYAFSGSIDAIDVSNPLEIYLFYKELNQVIILDNNLAFRGKINLSDWGITQAACIARSYDNGIWVFDLGDFQLKKFDKMGVLIQSSGNFRQLNQMEQFAPIVCMDDGNKVVLADSISGVFVFDVFGSFLKKYAISGLKNIQLSGKESFFYLKEGSLFEQSFNGPKKFLLKINELGTSYFMLFDATIFLAFPNQIKRFKLLE